MQHVLIWMGVGRGVKRKERESQADRRTKTGIFLGFIKKKILTSENAK